jgi:hypothetical protein
VKRALLVLVVAVATLAAVVAVGSRLAALAAGAGFLPPDDPAVVLDREVTDQFGFANPVLWVLEARDGTLWTTARLRRLVALTDDVLGLPGVVALDVVGLASPNMRDVRVTDDGFEPVYLMGEVPETAEGLIALRQRIDTDPAYAGTLVSRDGRAAMVLANFRTDADARAIGTAALAVRDRYRDADTMAWATGPPILAATVPAAFVAGLPRVVGSALVAFAIFAAAIGIGAAGAALLGAALALAWTGVGVALAGLPFPWALEAALPAALVAAASAAGAEPPLALAAILGASALGAAAVTGPPAHALWLATAAAVPLAAVAAWLARPERSPVPRRLAGVRTARVLAAVLALGAALGTVRLELSLGLFGYGERYLPPDAAADLAAVRRLFPPPSSLALRVRGTPGFVSAPEVLRAIDGAASAARADVAVRSAMSVADVVKTVNSAFNGGRPEFRTIPDDRIVAGRYLALAYSPAVRRFLDRAFASTTLWIHVDGDSPEDLARVRARVEAALAAQPIPGATTDPPAGDGALVTLMAATARRIAEGAALALLLVTGAAGAVRGRRAATRALVAGAVTASAGAGILGWTWQAADLVSVPLVAATAVTTAAIAGLAPAMPRLAAGLAGAALVAAAVLPAAALVTALLLGPALALLACRPADRAEPAG